MLPEKGPRDRAVRFRSKEALVQARRERAKELAFADGPFGRTAEEIMPEIAERFAEVLRPVSERLYDVERLGECKDTR